MTLSTIRTTLVAILWIACATTESLPAQSDSTPGEITGTILNEDDVGVPGATILLLHPENESQINGVSSGESGNFSLTADPGRYLLQISYISYDEYQTELVVESGMTVDLGEVSLSPEGAELEEIVIEGERSYMEMNFDSRSFNVGSDITSLGGSALDVLDNVPSITTDFEGNVSLRGNQGVQILVNGRPSNLVRGGTDGLSSIPASMIEEVEVITNPSARYEAQGTGGIINIILVDDARLGFNGNVRVRTGYPQDHGVSTNLNYHKNSINWFANFDFEYERQPERGYTFQSIHRDTSYAYTESRDITEKELERDIYFGADIYLPNEQILTTASRLSVENGEEDGDLFYTDYVPDEPGVYQNVFEQWEILRQTDRRNLEEADESDKDVRLQYENRFEGEDHRLTADVDFEFGNEQETLNQTGTDLVGTSSFNDQRSLNEEVYREFRIDGDYERPLGDSGRFEAGFRVNMDWQDNDYLIEEFIDGEWTEPSNDIGMLDNFSYLENVNALYSIYSGATGAFTYQMGLRAENTRINTELNSTGEKTEQNYLNLFPSLFLSYTFSEQNSMQLSYSRRISRPWSRMLLPYTEIEDSRNREMGNPELTPEFGNSYELGWLRRWETGSVLTSVYHRYRTEVIERVYRIDDDGFTTQFPINLATEKAWGIEFSADQDLHKTLQLSGSLNLYQSDRNGEYQDSNYESSSESFTSRLRVRWRFLPGWNFQTYLFYRGPQETTQGRRDASSFAGSGISREFSNGKARLSLSIRDLFNSRQSSREILEPDSYTHREFSWSSRSFRLTFQYNFSSEPSR